MDYLNYNTNIRKYKHLSFEERVTIQIRLKDGFSVYKIAKELGRSYNTIRNEIINRGTVTQIIQDRKIKVYLADAGENTYIKNRKQCCPKFKRLSCTAFINHICYMIKTYKWSIDACVGYIINHHLFDRSEIVCTKTLYITLT